jgi:broad specificity phosphatase PhoE
MDNDKIYKYYNNTAIKKNINNVNIFIIIKKIKLIKYITKILKWLGYSFSIIKESLKKNLKEVTKDNNTIIITDNVNVLNDIKKNYLDKINFIYYNITNNILESKSINNTLHNDIIYNLSKYLTNYNTNNKKIYISRHGQSIGQTKKIIGGNSVLTESGIEYSKKLKNFIDSKIEDDKIVKIYCSTLKRTIQTCYYFLDDEKYVIERMKNLDEINGGLFEDYDYKYIKNNYNEIYKDRTSNKYEKAWPFGESYKELKNRLIDIILLIEKADTPILIIAHRAICRVLFSYLLDIDIREYVNKDISSHTLYEFDIIDNKTNMNIHKFEN